MDEFFVKQIIDGEVTGELVYQSLLTSQKTISYRDIIKYLDLSGFNGIFTGHLLRYIGRIIFGFYYDVPNPMIYVNNSRNPGTNHKGILKSGNSEIHIRLLNTLVLDMTNKKVLIAVMYPINKDYTIDVYEGRSSSHIWINEDIYKEKRKYRSIIRLLSKIKKVMYEYPVFAVPFLNKSNEIMNKIISYERPQFNNLEILRFFEKDSALVATQIHKENHGIVEANDNKLQYLRAWRQ